MTDIYEAAKPEKTYSFLICQSSWSFNNCTHKFFLLVHKAKFTVWSLDVLQATSLYCYTLYIIVIIINVGLAILYRFSMYLRTRTEITI